MFINSYIEGNKIKKNTKNITYMCNYHFIAEAQDIKPDLKNTKCSGLPKEEAEKGNACRARIKENGK